MVAELGIWSCSGVALGEQLSRQSLCLEVVGSTPWWSYGQSKVFRYLHPSEV